MFYGNFFAAEDGGCRQENPNLPRFICSLCCAGMAHRPAVGHRHGSSGLTEGMLLLCRRLSVDSSRWQYTVMVEMNHRARDGRGLAVPEFACTAENDIDPENKRVHVLCVMPGTRDGALWCALSWASTARIGCHGFQASESSCFVVSSGPGEPIMGRNVTMQPRQFTSFFDLWFRTLDRRSRLGDRPKRLLRFWGYLPRGQHLEVAQLLHL